jgi:hypothetical protein
MQYKVTQFNAIQQSYVDKIHNQGYGGIEPLI